jgi:hypothetical protein
MCLFNKKSVKSYELSQKKFGCFEVKVARNAVRLDKIKARNIKLQNIKRCPKLVDVLLE